MLLRNIYIYCRFIFDVIHVYDEILLETVMKRLVLTYKEKL